MNISLPRFLAFLTLAVASQMATAGVFSEDLSKCFVKSASENDQFIVMRWLFASAAHHPSLKFFVVVNQDMRESVHEDMARVTQRLLTVDCKAEAKLAIKADGRNAIVNSFSAFGEMASIAIFSSPAVSNETRRFTTYLDVETIRALLPVEP